MIIIETFEPGHPPRSGFPQRLSLPNIPSGAGVLSSNVKSAVYSAQRVSVLRYIKSLFHGIPMLA